MNELLKLRLPPVARSAGVARHAVQRRLHGLVGDPILADVELLVSELVTNSLRHADGSPIELSVCADGPSLLVEVKDRGPGFDPDAVARRPKPSAGGWGLTLVQRIADRWGALPGHGSSSVWFRIGRAS